MAVISINLYRIMGLMIRNGIFSNQITCFISISSVANLDRTSAVTAVKRKRTRVGVARETEDRREGRGGKDRQVWRKGVK